MTSTPQHGARRCECYSEGNDSGDESLNKRKGMDQMKKNKMSGMTKPTMLVVYSHSDLNNLSIYSSKQSATIP